MAYDVEICTALGLVRLTNLLPDALPDLVGRRLPWPAEITVDLELDELIRFHREGDREGYSEVLQARLFQRSPEAVQAPANLLGYFQWQGEGVRSRRLYAPL